MAEKSNKKTQVPKVESNTMQQPKVKTNYYYKEHVEAANDQQSCINVENNIKNRIIKEDDHKVFCEDGFHQEEDYYDYKQFKIGYFLRSLSLKGVTKDQESNSISRVVQTEQNHHHFDLSGVGACEAPYSTYKISCYLNALSDAYNSNKMEEFARKKED